MLVILEAQLGLLEPSLALHVNLIAAIDQDVRHRPVGEQGFERPQAEEFVEDIGDQRFPLEQTERNRLHLRIEQADDDAAQLRLGLFAADPLQAVEVQPVEQRAVNPFLELVIRRLARVADCDVAGQR